MTLAGSFEIVLALALVLIAAYPLSARSWLTTVDKIRRHIAGGSRADSVSWQGRQKRTPQGPLYTSLCKILMQLAVFPN